MQINAMLKGIAAGAAVGTVCYMVAGSTNKQRKHLKRSTGRALHAVGAVIEGVSDMMR